MKKADTLRALALLTLIAAGAAGLGAPAALVERFLAIRHFRGKQP
jgi:hypothetical protein